MKKAALTAIITVLILLCAGPAAAALDPTRVSTKMDISKLTVEELRLYRNAVFARHCHRFTDKILQNEFLAWQEKRCGDDFAWTDKSPETPLTADEKAFVTRAKAREDELRQGQVRTVKEVNRSQFKNLTKPALDRLFRDGFVVVPGGHVQLFHVYEENDYRGVPSFITADSVLQLYHLYFDFTLREIESERLLPAAQGLAGGMLERLRKREAATNDPALRAAIHRAVLYFAVAVDLATPLAAPAPAADGGETYAENIVVGPPEDDRAARAQRPAPGWLSAADREIFLRQRSLILDAAGTATGPVMGKVDYTMFIPRGHYTRSQKLKDYFRTMMWLGLPGFSLNQQEMPIEVSLAIAWELAAAPDLMKQYQLIYEPTGFYVGESDDITPRLVKEVADAVAGPAATFEQWTAKKEAIRAELIKRNPARVVGRLRPGDDRMSPQVRFMGMRYVPDSEVLQRLVNPDLRPWPTGLDIFGVMGVDAALGVLKDSKIGWSGYWPEMKKLQDELGGLTPAGPANLYWRWLRLLKTLNAKSPEAAPAFMRTPAWEDKNLSTALGSWAELRHDTILYAKPAAAECGDGEMPARMVGFVEARPDFFAELLALQKFTYAGLKDRGLLTDRMENVAKQMQDLFAFLEQTSRKELAGQRLSDEEFEQVRLYGSRLEQLTLMVLASDVGSWSDVTGTDKSMPVVADVYTNGQAGQALEVAVGLADEIYALVEIDGYLYITRGAVFSYYEFRQPVSRRLSDEGWQEMLKKGPAPARPDWVWKFFVEQPASKPDAAGYSSGC